MPEATKHVLGTLITWMGQSGVAILSPGDCSKLLKMLDYGNEQSLLDRSMQLHEDIATGGLTGPLADLRRKLIKEWKSTKGQK
jgi:hypothetical protein